MPVDKFKVQLEVGDEETEMDMDLFTLDSHVFTLRSLVVQHSSSYIRCGPTVGTAARRVCEREGARK